MRIKLALMAAATAGLATMAAASGASAQAYGSAAFGTYRECGASAVCDGAQPGQQIVASAISGGGSSTSNTSMTLDGSVGGRVGSPLPVILPNDPSSHVAGTVAFGSSDLPLLTASSYSGATDRMGMNEIGYQSYTNVTGAAINFNIAGMLHIDSYNGTSATGTDADGALAVSYLAVWDPSILNTIPDTSAINLISGLLQSSCGATGVLAASRTSSPLVNGGPASPVLNVTTGSCSGSNSTSADLILDPGQTVLVVAGLQLLTNRGGYIDASSTYITSFTDTVDVQALQSGSQILSGAPEPASWALMIGGFGLAGAALRRRRQLAV